MEFKKQEVRRVETLYQCAHATTGVLGMCCKTCHNILAHPNTNDTCNSLQIQHLERGCGSGAGFKRGAQQTLHNAVKVCFKALNISYFERLS